MEKDKVIKTLKSIFTNFLLKYQFDYDDEYSRATIKNEFDSMCQPFVDGGLINGFMNIFDITNNPSENDSKIIDTYLTFEKGDPHIVLRTSIRVVREIDISINNSHDITADTELFRKDVLNYKKIENVEQITTFLKTKEERARKMKMMCINEQKFEPAAEWRYVERFVQDLISKIGIDKGETPENEG